MDIKEAIKSLEFFAKNPQKGLLEDVFLFASRITPMINVDLLIKNKKNQTLLTWRHDSYYGPGWHVLGGIIRYKEKITDRIRAVAKNELGAKIKFKKAPLAITEVINPAKKDRGHFISLLYKCELITLPDKNFEFRDVSPKPGQWAWHDKCPENLIPIHKKIYKKFI